MLPPPGLVDEDIGPPPGIDKFTSLESLKLDLPVQVQQYDQIPFSKEYLEPSVNNLIAFKGMICDTSESDTLGLWNQEMHLIDKCVGLVENVTMPIYTVGDKLIQYFGEAIYCIDLEKKTKSLILEQSLSVICVSEHLHPRIVGISEGHIHLWKTHCTVKTTIPEPIYNNLKVLKVHDNADLIASIQQDEEFDNVIQLGCGKVFVRSRNVGEVFVCDFTGGRLLSCQFTEGNLVRSWCCINYDTIAFGGSGQIVIVNYNKEHGTVYQFIQSTKDVIYHGLCCLEKNLYTISQSATITLWNLQNTTKVSTLDLKFTEGEQALMVLNQDYLIATDVKKKEFAIVTNTLERKFTYKSRVKQVNGCCVYGKFIAVVQSYGLFHDEQMNFQNEIEIFHEDPKLIFQKRRELEHVESHTVMFLNDSEIQYICKNKSVDPLLVIWNFKTGTIQEIELLVEKYKSCQLYLNRMAFSYVTQPKQSFNLFAQAKKEAVSGISVYEKNHSLMKVTLLQVFEVEIYGLPREDTLFVLNARNNIEIWDITKQAIIQKADCRPSNIKSIKFNEQFLFLVTQSEWIIRDLSLNLVAKVKGGNCQKILVANSKFYVKENRKLSVWDLQEQKVTFISYINDFCFREGQLLIINDASMTIITQ